MTRYIMILCSLISVALSFIPNQEYTLWQIENKFVLSPQNFDRQDSSHSYDVRHYRLYLNLPMTSSAYDARAVIKIVARENNFDTFNLHFVNLVCDSVKRGNTNLIFLVNSGRLKITLDRIFGLGETCKVDIYYHRVAGTANQGFYFYTTAQTGYHNLAYTTYSPYDARYWFPCFDELWDKADEGCDFFVTVPDSFTVCSNGLLDSVRTNAGQKTFYWSHHYPISTYLMVFTSTIYCTWSQWYRPTSSDSIECKYYVWRIDSSRSISAFQNLLDMMQFFADTSIYGPYPFEKYGMNAVSPFLWGGMENQTMTMIHRNWLNGYDSGISHELSHSWWGDMVTCFGWQNVWLNEGFATYSDALYSRHQLGHSAFISIMNSRANSYFSEDNSMRFPLYNPSINNIFSWGHEYCKGSWVQHMLRYIEGDTANTPGIFFRAMRVYGDSFKYKNASTEDYKRIHEQVTGLDLDWFFDEWVYQAGYPKYYYDWWSEALTNPNQYRIITQISQNNGNLAPTVFHMPLQIRFTTTNLDTIVTIPITTSPQTDTFYFAYQPTSMTLDPNNWILKKTFLGIQEEDYKPLSVDRGLLKIYPNPAKSAVNIRYSLPVKGKISLKLYDASGKLVKTLIDQNKNAGIHTLKIENPLRSCLSEASSKLKISNGVYFIELATPIQKYTRKILLIE